MLNTLVGALLGHNPFFKKCPDNRVLSQHCTIAIVNRVLTKVMLPITHVSITH